MIEAAKEKAKKIASRVRIAAELTAILLIFLAWAGTKSGHVHGEFQVDGIVIGGGTSEQVARDQQLALLSSALPSTAMTPPQVVTPAQAPLPSRKPAVPK
jgi:hypothetical protein